MICVNPGMVYYKWLWSIKVLDFASMRTAFKLLLEEMIIKSIS